MTEPEGRRGGLVRWGVLTLVVLVSLFLLSTVVYGVLSRSARLRWERLASGIRAKGQPLTFGEIEAARPALADGANGVVAIRDAARILDAVAERDESGVLSLDSECEADFFKGLQRRCLPATRNYIESRGQALTALSNMMSYEGVRLEPAYGGASVDAPSQALSTASRHRKLAKLVNVDAILKTVDGSTQAAVDAVVLQLHLSEPHYAEPVAVQRLVAVASDWMVVTTFEGLLQAHELGDIELERLQREWTRHARHQSPRPSLLGERASFIRLTDRQWLMAHTRAVLARVKNAPTSRSWSPNPLDWIPFKDDWFLYENRVQGVAILTRLLDVSTDPSKLLAVARHELQLLPQSSRGHTMIRIVLPSLSRGIELHLFTVARFRCVPLAIAAERFRLATGRFPDHKEEVVPQHLEALPRDPFDDKPIRYAKTDAGIVVYSIGENGVDDGGEVVPREGERRGLDFGVRVLDPAGRGLRWLDADDPSGP